MRSRKHLLATALIATLPLAAGFAFSRDVLAQGMQYDGPAAAPVLPVGTPQNAAAVDMTRQAQLEQQVRDLTNQLEQRGFELRQLKAAFEKFSADTNLRLQDLESKAGAPQHPAASTDGFETPPSDAPQATTPPQPSAPMPVKPAPASQAQQPADGEAGTLGDPNGAFKPDAAVDNRPDRTLGSLDEGPKDKNAANGTVTSGKPQMVTATQAYEQAFSYLQQNNYSDAQRAFSDFLKTYPTHPLAANAQYWLGETYFAQTQYSVAAKTFAKSFKEHPQGQKAPDSLLKLALTLEKMDKKNDACLTLGELAKRFASGPASVLKRATEEGQRMGCKS